MTALVVVHGGPGCSHDYLLSLAEIARSGRPVIHYDQLGGGRSTHRRDAPPEFWTVDLFLSELDNLLEYLGVADHYYLLGQSWGGMLGAEHAIRRPPGLRALDLEQLAGLNGAVGRARRRSCGRSCPQRSKPRSIATKQTAPSSDPEYLAATQAYYDLHVCRVVPNPPEVVRMQEILAEDPTVYNTMNGPNEFFATGTLARLERGRGGAVHPSADASYCRAGTTRPRRRRCEPFFERIPEVRWEIFEDSSHMPFVEEPERYRAIVEGFLAAQD